MGDTKSVERKGRSFILACDSKVVMNIRSLASGQPSIAGPTNKSNESTSFPFRTECNVRFFKHFIKKKGRDRMRATIRLGINALRLKIIPFHELNTQATNLSHIPKTNTQSHFMLLCYPFKVQVNPATENPLVYDAYQRILLSTDGYKPLNHA